MHQAIAPTHVRIHLTNLPFRRAFIAILALSLLVGCGEKADDDDAAAQKTTATLTVFHAGSLSIPFRELSELFETQHPGVTVLAEAAGSRDTARKVSDLHRPCDVLGSADYKVIENLLMPEHADFNIRFATNEMAIAYTDDSKMADTINTDNWTEILLTDGVIFGRADPNSDPCGYRTVMLFQLAEQHVGTSGLAKRLEDAHDGRYIRPKETDLLALLEAGEIDYLPIYRSVATQHDLKFVTLPDEVNLKNAEFADLYSTAVIQVTGKKPGEFITRAGAPIVYGVTIPKNAPNRDLALAYVELLLSPEGRAIMDRNGQMPIAPAVTTELDAVPDELKPYCTSP
ncbi:MAG: tungstate ABC transporter substrate-binding protein WtpA [Phycisphaerales bacterium]|nr:tungstate ABC transporter substrate-binding protein WtpA [Phycisphaerales bacterium]